MAKTNPPMITVSVVYALPDEQRIFSVHIAQGATARQAIEASGVLDYYPQIDMQQVKIGVFSEVVSLEYVVAAGERIEIYRPLIADPKELRKQRAQKAVAEGRANQKTGGRVQANRKKEGN